MNYIMDYVIVRTYSAKIFAGYLKHREGTEVELLQARELLYAYRLLHSAPLSQLAVEGIKNPIVEGIKNPIAYKLSCKIDKVILTEAIEIFDCTDTARLSIENMP